MATAARIIRGRGFFTLLMLAIIAGSMAHWISTYGIMPPLADLFPSGELVIAVDASYPPFATATDDGALIGLDIDLARALAERIGIPVRFVNMGYDGLYDSIFTGQTDAVISALLVDEFRLADVQYTQFYFDAGLMLITPVSSAIQSMDALPTHALAYEFGAQADSEARRWSRRIAPFTHHPYELPAYALESVRLGQSDAALVDAISGRLYLRQHPAWDTQTHYVTHQPLAIAVRIDRKHVLRLLNNALKSLQEDGTLDAIIARWL